MNSWAIVASVFVVCAASVSCSRRAAQERAAPSNKEFRIEQVSALKPGASRKELLRLLPAGAKHIPGFSSLGETSEFFIVSNRWEVAFEVRHATDRLLRAPVVTDMGDDAERAAHSDPFGRATIRWLGPAGATTNHEEREPGGSANRSQPVGSETNRTRSAAGSGG